MAYPLFFFLLLCYVSVECQISLEVNNSTLPAEQDVTGGILKENTSDVSLKDPTLLSSLRPPAPSPAGKSLALPEDDDLPADKSVPDDDNDVLPPVDASAKADANEKVQNAPVGDKPDLSALDKCGQGIEDCIPVTEKPVTVRQSTEGTTENQGVASREYVTTIDPALAETTTIEGLPDDDAPSPPSIVTPPAVEFTSNASSVAQATSTPAPASENLIPVEPPVPGRKELPPDDKDATAPLTHDEKAESVKPVRDRQSYEPVSEGYTKTQPTLIPPVVAADDRTSGTRNDGDYGRGAHERQGSINQITSPPGDFPKPLDVYPTVKNITKEPNVKHLDSSKKPEHLPLEPDKGSTSQDHGRTTASLATSESSEDFPSPSLFTSSSSSPTVVPPTKMKLTSSTAATTTTTKRTTTAAAEPTTTTATLKEDTLTTSTMSLTSPATKRATSAPSVVSSTTEEFSPFSPGWITNRTCSELPVCVQVRVSRNLCPESDSSEERELLKRMVIDVVSKYSPEVIHPSRAVLDLRCFQQDGQEEDVYKLDFFLADSSGEFDEDLTSIAGVLLRRLAKKSRGRSSSKLQVLAARLVENGRGGELHEEEPAVGGTDHAQETPTPLIVDHSSGMIAAVAISAVAGACLCLLCLLMVVMKQRLAAQQQQLQQANGHRPPNGLDAYSLDSFSINASFRRRRPGRSSVGSFTNHAFVGDNDDTALLSKRLSSAALASMLKNSRNLIEEEFQKIPMNMPKPREIPPGAEVKNRYVNVVPNPKTRVLLADNTEDPVKTYINANYVRGYDGRPSFYIACQSPLAEYVEDFWKMVWEQQSRVILMLTLLEENGIRRCAPYFPESTLDCRQLHGDYQVTLLKKDVTEFYTLSIFKLYCMEKNLFREIRHFWYTAWPAVGVPNDPMSLVTYLLQARPFMNCNSGPTVVHCSAGTGRTGTVIALDRCMREYEESRTMDIVQCVAQIRRDRGGAVQNKQQYLLIHEAMLEYATYTANQSNRPSIQGSD